MKPNNLFAGSYQSNARQMSLFILNKLQTSPYTLDAIIERELRRCTLDKRDRALVTTLVFGVLRQRKALDWMIQSLSATKFSKIDPLVLDILRLGLFQIAYLPKIPSSAAVNTSVDLVKACHAAPKKFLTGFVNGILRNADRNKTYQALPSPDAHSQQPENTIAVNKSYPTWIIRKWLNQHGFKATIKMCDAQNPIPPLTIRVNTLNATLTEVYETLSPLVEDMTPTPYSAQGFTFHHPKHPIFELKGFREGWFQVQDEAAQLVVPLLNPQPGESILDACAGKGGKTGCIAQYMRNRGRIVAIDQDAGRLRQLEQEMHRLSVSIVTKRQQDLLHPPQDPELSRGFDRILLDAPCSGMGVIRRNPDIKWRMTLGKIRQLQSIQKTLLHNLAPRLTPQGVLLYVVCSTEPEENEEVIASFLARHPDFTIDNNLADISQNCQAMMTKEGFFRTSPHANNMDGFFAVRLIKKAPSDGPVARDTQSKETDQ